MSEIEKEIRELRKKIDEIDEKIVRNLNERAKIVAEIRQLKNKEGFPIYDPKREEEIFEKLAQMSEEVLSNEALKEIYEKILSVMKEIDK